MYHLLIEKRDPFGFGEDSLSCETRGGNNWELEHPVCAVDSEADEERINEAVSFDTTKQIRCTKVRVRKKRWEIGVPITLLYICVPVIVAFKWV